MMTVSTKMNFALYILNIIPLVFCEVLPLNDISSIASCADCTDFPRENSTSSISHFSAIFKPSGTPNIVVGARNAVFMMSVDGQLRHNISIMSTKIDYENCLHIKDKDECGNIINAIFPWERDGLMLFCGTNSGQRARCWKANETSIVGPPQSYSFYGHDKRISTISDPYIYQSSGQNIRRVNIYSPRDKLELKISNVAPNFVSVHEFGNHFYYFFTEMSREVSETKSRVTYSRVGRVCKYDVGGQKRSSVQQQFMTFEMARLLCTTSQDGEAFQYNNLEATSVVIGQDGNVYIYGLFRAAKPASDLFAVCRYSFSEIAEIFSDNRYYEITSNVPKVVTVGSDDPRQKKCESGLNTRTVTYVRFTQQIEKRVLKVKSVSPDSGKPVIVRRRSGITHILADSVTIADNTYDIVRLFDPKYLYEIFVPTKFFDDSTTKTYLSTRKISEESLNINQVKRVKLNGVSPKPENPTSSSSAVPPSTTSVPMTTNYALPMGKLSSTPTTAPVPRTTNTTTQANSTNSNNATNLDKVTTTASFVHSTTANPKPTRNLSGLPGPSATSPPALTPGTPSSLRASAKPTAKAVTPQERIIIAANEKLVSVPIASCDSFKSCRDCVSAMNPYCAWRMESCVQLGSSESSAYIQDLNGKYAEVCPSVDVSCELVPTIKMAPTAEITVKCTATGLPNPQVFRWSKSNTSSLAPGVTVDGEILRIQSLTPTTVGAYTCLVGNGVTNNSCSVQFSAPELQCTTIKSNKDFKLACKATGYPQPTLELISMDKQPLGTTSVSIKGNYSYQFVAHNVFGASAGGVYKLISKTVEFKIDNVDWNDELSDTSSQVYMDLKKKIVDEVQKLYKDNDLYQDVTSVSFREGSCVATVTVSGLKKPTSGENDLSRELEEAVRTKKGLGEFKVSEYDGEKTSAVAQTSSSSGVAVWLLFLLLILIGIIVFVAGYFCGLRRMFYAKCYGRRRTPKNSCSEEADVGEMKPMSRSEKARESERMLLGRHEGKKPKSPTKNNHDANVDSKHGSVEIKQYDNCEDQSNC